MPTPCAPHALPLEDLDGRSILSLVGNANACLARYDGLLQTLPNFNILLSPITANEAVLSSKKIEGTQANLGEVLGADAGLTIAESRAATLKK